MNKTVRDFVEKISNYKDNSEFLYVLSETLLEKTVKALDEIDTDKIERFVSTVTDADFLEGLSEIANFLKATVLDYVSGYAFSMHYGDVYIAKGYEPELEGAIDLILSYSYFAESINKLFLTGDDDEILRKHESLMEAVNKCYESFINEVEEVNKKYEENSEE